MKKLLSEGIGTFLLTLIFVVASNNGSGQWASAAVAAGLAALLFSSRLGGHFNPAVTVAAWLFGQTEKREVGPIVAAQALGAVVAALIGSFFLGCLGQTKNISPVQFDLFGGLAGEFFGAFGLVWAFLGGAKTSESGRAFSVGAAFFGLLVALGPLSGGAFNPAVGLGATVAGMAVWSDIWVFLVGPFLGGAAGATVFQVVHGREA